MKLRYIFATIAAVAALSACNADMDYDIVAPILSKPDASSIQASLQGDNYVISWPAGNQNMQVTRYANGTKSGTEVVTGGTYTHYAVETNVANSYVLKYTDGHQVGDCHSVQRRSRLCILQQQPLRYC